MESSVSKKVGSVLAEDPINFWYPLAFSKQLKAKKLLTLTLYSYPLVIYRYKDQIRCFLNQCAHRRLPFQPVDSEYQNIKTSIDDGCLRCPYHGWIYGLDGKCINIPTNNPDEPIPPGAFLQRFPCKEYMGIIWVNLNKDKADENDIIYFPPRESMENPNTSDTIWQSNAGVDFTLETLIDSPHLNQLHRGTGIFPSLYDQKNDQIVIKNESDLVNNKMEVLSTWVSSKSAAPSFRAAFYPPYYVITDLKLPQGLLRFHQLLIPVEPGVTRVLTRTQDNLISRFIFPFLSALYRKIFIDTQIRQHFEMVYQQQKQHDLADFRGDILISRTDSMIMEYRSVQKARKANLNERYYCKRWFEGSVTSKMSEQFDNSSLELYTNDYWFSNP